MTGRRTIGGGWLRRSGIAGLLTVTGLLLSSCSASPPDPSDSAPLMHCDDGSLTQSSAHTTLTFGGSGTEFPALSTENALSVPERWSDADRLLMPSATDEKDAALACLLSFSGERHAAPADVSIDKPDKDNPARIVVHESVSANDESEDSWVLGGWQVTYEEKSTRQVMSVTHPDGSTSRTTIALQRGDLLAALSLPPFTVARPGAGPGDGPAMEAVDVDLDLSAAALVQSERIPATLSGDGHVSWQISNPKLGLTFWAVVRPSPAAALSLGVEHGDARWVGAVEAWIPWLVFLVVLVAVLCRGRREARSSPVGRAAALDVMVLTTGLAVCVAARVLADVAWAYRSGAGPGPGGLPYRVEDLAFVAVGLLLCLRFFVVRRAGRIVVALLATCGVFAYVGPEAYALTFSSLEDPVSAGDELAWQLYFHAAIALSVATAVFASCILAVQRSLQRLELRSAVTVRTRLRAVVVAAASAVALVAQNARSAAHEADLDRFDPGGPVAPGQHVAWLLRGFPWLPDYFLGLAPAVIFYACMLCAVLSLGACLRARAATDAEPSRAEQRLAAVVFAALSVGVFGSYRGIGFPVAFLVTWSLTQVLVVRRHRRALTGLLGIAGKSSLHALEMARRRLLLATSGAATTSKAEDLVALGPRVSAWDNAVYGASLAALGSAPIVVYDLITLIRSGSYSTYVTSSTGVYDAFIWIAWELSSWVVLGFAIGFSWRLIPGRRGIYKALCLSVPVVLGLLADAAFVSALHQTDGGPNWGQFGVTVTVVVFVSVVLDVASLREAEGWDVVSILRLRNTRWLAAYGLVAAGVLVNVAKVISDGEPVTSLPSAFLTSVLHVS